MATITPMAFTLGDRPVRPLTADIAVVAPGDHLHVHPAEALLIVEVAFGSLEIDTQIKPPPACPTTGWVDGVAKRVRVFRGPHTDGYASQTAIGPGGFAEPVTVDVPPLDLAALFRGL